MNNQLVKKIALIFCVVLGVAAFVGFLAWINNVTIAKQWDPAEIKQVGEEIIRPTYKGLIHWLDKLAVDYSTVSTLIIFFGLLLLSFRCYQIAHAKEGTNVPDDFPSFKHYNTITIALGLMGTIWGLIMVGNYNMETLTNPNLMMPELMKCMRTALYSTLVALFWIFVVIYPASWVMPAAYRCVSGYTGGKGKTNIISILGELGSTAGKATTKLREMPKAFNDIKSSFAVVLDLLIKTNKDGKQEGILPELKIATNNLNSATQQQKKTNEDIQVILGSFSTELENERQRREKAEKRTSEAEQLYQGIQNMTNSLQNLLGKMKEWKKE